MIILILTHASSFPAEFLVLPDLPEKRDIRLALRVKTGDREIDKSADNMVIREWQNPKTAPNLHLFRR